MNRSARLLLSVAAFTCLALPNLAQANLCSSGDRADVLWKGTWYPAVVKKARGDSCYIHYNGYNASWDEWVGADRIRISGTPSETVAVGVPVAFNEGDPVSILWHGSWYPAHVLRARGNKIYIHYDGYGSNWDEWVGPTRYRQP